jgi:hypothetical protein
MLRAGQLPAGAKWRFAEALGVRGDAQAIGDRTRACADYRRSVALFDETEQTSPLVDLVKEDADRVHLAFYGCPSTAPSGPASGRPFRLPARATARRARTTSAA